MENQSPIAFLPSKPGIDTIINSPASLPMPLEDRSEQINALPIQSPLPIATKPTRTGKSRARKRPSDNGSWRVSGIRTFNGRKSECYICHKKFTNTTRLDKHVKSPTHGYGDPTFLGECPHANCNRIFETLPALWDHIESERCGVGRFRQEGGPLWKRRRDGPKGVGIGSLEQRMRSKH